MAAKDYNEFNPYSSPGHERFVLIRDTWAKLQKAWKRNAPVAKESPLTTEVPITVLQGEEKGAELSLDLTKLPYVEGTICVAGQPVQVKRVVIPEATQ